MKKFLCFFVSLFWLMNSSYAQNYDTTKYYGKMNYIFHYTDKTIVTSGILRDYGIEFLNLDNYTGSTLHDSNFVSISEWRLLYGSLYGSQINNNANLLGLDSINNLIDKYNYSGMPITFMFQHYNYQKIKENAITSNLLTISNERIYDVANRSSSPYETKTLFAVAPIRQAAFTGDNQFIFRPELFVSNTGKSISQISYRKQGSSLFQVVNFNTPFTIHYDSIGVYNIDIQVKYSDNSVVIGHSKIMVYQDNSSSTSSRFNPYFPDLEKNITATKPYLGNVGSGQMIITYAQNNNTGKIRKPLIVVEGFDPGGSYGYGYDQFIDNIETDFNLDQSIDLNYYLDDINEYDLIFVNWDNGKDYIQRNAYLLQSIIKDINDNKINYNGLRQSNVIIGLSMGGLVGRYALRDMELNSLVHETRLFITHDSPHWGANIPVGLQMAAQNLAPWEILNINFKPFCMKYVELFPDIKEAIEMFNSPAAKQMLIQRYVPGANFSSIADNAEHNSFISELNTLGWPINCKNLTLSNGSCNGTKQFADNSTIFSLYGDRSMSYGGSLWRSLALSLLGGTNLITNIILTKNNPSFNGWAMFAQFPLSVFSTKSSIGLDFKVRAVPASGTYEIFRGDIYSKKKILGIINNKTYIIKTRALSNSSMLPLDNAPGGVYDVNYFGIDIDIIKEGLPNFFNNATADILEERFCFVPTASSLDIINPQSNYLKPLCDTAACLSPSRINDYYAPQNNELHISYTQPSSNWINMQQFATANCTKICASSLTISGASTLCTTSSIYSLQNSPLGVSISWSAIPSNYVILVPNGTSCNVTKNGNQNGAVTIYANITNCGKTVSISKKFMLDYLLLQFLMLHLPIMPPQKEILTVVVLLMYNVIHLALKAINNG